MPRIQSKLPLLLGEGWGEGLAREARKLHSSCFPHPSAKWRNQKQKVCAANPSPRPSPTQKGEGDQRYLSTIVGALTARSL